MNNPAKPVPFESAEELWTDFAKAILSDLPEHTVQYRETRKAFFAGLLSAISNVQTLADAEMNEEERVQKFDQFRNEAVTRFRIMAAI